MTSSGPESQKTPTRPPSFDPDESDATHYAPRPTPPLASADDDSTRYAPRAIPPLAGADDDNTRYAPRPGAPAQPPSSAWTPTTTPPLQDVPTRTSPGAWAPSNWHLPEDRFSAPAEQPTRQPMRFSAVKVLSWALALVVLAVAAGVVYVRFIRTPPVDDAVKVPEASVSVSKAKVVRGDEVVRQYLNALAAGDVAKALTLGPPSGNGSQVLLTNAAYAASVKATPISNVTVPTTDANATDIPATYTVGDQQVKTSFKVVKQDNGSWQLEKTTATFRFLGTKVDNVPIRVNGVVVNWEAPLELVPGSYALSTGLPFIAFDAKDGLTILNLNYSDVNTHNAAPALTEPGQRALIDAGRRSLQACASRKEARPANCPNGLDPPVRLDPATIEWRLIGDPFTGARPGLNATDQSRAEINMVVNLTFSATVAGTQRRINANPYAFSSTVSADMTVGAAEQVQPQWRS